jgi:Glycosyltransferase family 87
MDVKGNQIGRDFINTWAGPQIAMAGKAQSLYDLQSYQTQLDALWGRPLSSHNFSYPPSAILMFWPFAQLPYFVALPVWLLVTFAGLAIGMLSQLPRKQRGIGLLLLAVSPAVVINSLSGQNGCLSAALLIGGMLLLDRRPYVAGILFGLLSYKPHLGLVLAFVLLALDARRTIAAAALTTAALVSLSAAVFGLEPFSLYLTATRDYQFHLLEQWNGFYVYMMPTWFAPLRSAGVAYQTALTLQAVLSCVVIAITCWAVRQTRDSAARVFVVAAATPLALPYAFTYDLPALAVASVWLLTGRLRCEGSNLLILQCAWIAPLLSISLLVNQPDYASHLLVLAPVALTAFFAMSIHSARSTPVK